MDLAEMNSIDTDRDYRLQQLEDFILDHKSELSVDCLLVSFYLKHQSNELIK